MNIPSAELLQNSLQNLGNTFGRQRQLAVENAYRQKQLDVEKQRADVEQSFRNAMMQHYANIEEKQEDAATAQNKRLDAIEKKYGVQQAYQDLQTAQNNIQKGMQGMSLDKSLTPSDKTAYLKTSIDGLPDTIKTSILQNPQINALYQGKGDWEAVAAAVQAQTKGKLGATDLQIKDWQTAQDAADNADDPDEKARLQAVADMYKANLPAALKTTAPAVAPKPTQTKTIQYNEMGKPTNSVTSFAMPPSAPIAASQPPAAHIAYLQSHPEAAADFDAKYGPGASAQYLKQSQPIPSGGGFPITLPTGMPGSGQ